MTQSLPLPPPMRRRIVAFATLLMLSACAELGPNPDFLIPVPTFPPARAPDVRTITEGTPYVAFGGEAFGPRLETRVYAGDVAYSESENPISLAGPRRLPDQGYWRVQDGTFERLRAAVAAENDVGLLEDNGTEGCGGAVHSSFNFAFVAPEGQASVGYLDDAAANGTVFGVTTICRDEGASRPTRAAMAYERILGTADTMLGVMFD